MSAVAAHKAAPQARITDLLDADFLARLDRLDVLSRRMLRGRLQGERRAKRRGQSVEFADHRPYVVGDDLRFVDWNIYGRLEQLFLKVFLEEQDLTIHLAWDVSGSMASGTPAKGAFARKLAAALGYIALVHNNRLTLSAYADGLVGQLANLRGRLYVARMVELLLHAEARGVSDFEAVCRRIADSRAGRSVTVILSDLLYKEGYEAGLRRLIGRGHDLYVIQVLSPQEVEPEVRGDLKLIDVEDLDDAEVSVTPTLLEYYRRAVTGYCNEVKDFCARRGAGYVLTRSDAQVETLVLKTLRRMGMLQ